MKHNDTSFLLVDYSDGNLSAELRGEIERHLAECPTCREDLALIQSAFDALRDEPELLVPSHYFANLVPRIRQRLEGHTKRAGFLVFPAWLNRALSPVAAFLALLAVAGLFRLLTPTSEVAPPLELLVSQVPVEEVDSLIAYFSDTNDLLHGTETQQRIMETMPNPTLVSNHLAKGVLADAVVEPVSYSDPAVIDEQVSDLSDEDVSQVIAMLDQSQKLHTTSGRP